MFITPSEVALSGIAGTLLSAMLTLILTNRQANKRAADEARRELLRLEHGDRNAELEYRSRTQEHWRDDRRKLHVAFISAVRDQRGLFAIVRPGEQRDREISDGEDRLRTIYAEVELVASDPAAREAKRLVDSLAHMRVTRFMISDGNFTPEQENELKAGSRAQFDVIATALKSYVAQARLELGTPTIWTWPGAANGGPAGPGLTDLNQQPTGDRK